MKKLVLKKLDEKVRVYLKKQFPNKKLIAAKLGNATDVWGFNGMSVKTLDNGEILNYQLITNSTK